MGNGDGFKYGTDYYRNSRHAGNSKMRYYLDTNILVYLLSQSKDEIYFSVKSILSECSNILFASSISVSELILLYRIGKFKVKSYKTGHDLLDSLEQFSIRMTFFNEFHFKQYLALNIVGDHKDVIDHMIIAQAISDKMPLISSDHEFKKYVPQGLNLVFNRR